MVYLIVGKNKIHTSSDNNIDEPNNKSWTGNYIETVKQLESRDKVKWLRTKKLKEFKPKFLPKQSKRGLELVKTMPSKVYNFFGDEIIATLPETMFQKTKIGQNG